jgi:hypothetical protein
MGKKPPSLKVALQRLIKSDLLRPNMRINSDMGRAVDSPTPIMPTSGLSISVMVISPRFILFPKMRAR